MLRDTTHPDHAHEHGQQPQAAGTRPSRKGKASRSVPTTVCTLLLRNLGYFRYILLLHGDDTRRAAPSSFIFMVIWLYGYIVPNPARHPTPCHGRREMSFVFILVFILRLHSPSSFFFMDRRPPSLRIRMATRRAQGPTR
jgi:hypothetical protein